MPGVIKINPNVFQDERDAQAVAWNEALRLVMEDIGFEPGFEVTPEQKRFFRGTAYAKDEAALRRTIVARVATHDTSVSATPEQEAETVRLLESVKEMIGPQHGDYPVVEALQKSVAGGQARGETREPPGEEDVEAVEDGADLLRETAAAAAGGNVRTEKQARAYIATIAKDVGTNLGNSPDAPMFLREIAEAESRSGRDPNTYRDGYHGGVFQVDMKGFRETKNVTSHARRLADHHKRVKEVYGIDWNRVEWKDLRDPVKSAIAARLLLLTKAPPVPATREGRAAYWKEHYNSYHENAKGTIPEYLERTAPLATD